ncbi:MAG: sulfatase-like hydrolase/transferase [Planctomycetes bacterium]|nr:sulfatase-like hydrolase/transferase [Planctomycetota bacterium]
MSIERPVDFVPRVLAASLLVGLAVSSTRCGGDDDAPRARSLLLITIDTLRADHLSCYGYARRTTPRIDALAAAGARFERCLTPIPRTTQSLASLMTAKYPSEHGVLDLNRASPHGTLAAEHDTLAERFQDGGFATGAAVVLPFMVDAQGLDQGFGSYQLIPGEARANKVTDAALAWITKHQGEPFAFWAHYRDPHAPYYPPKPWNDAFTTWDGDGPLRDYYHYWPVTPDQRPVGGRLTDAMRAGKELRKYGTERIPPAEVERAIGLYDGDIAWTDAEIGRLLDGLAKLGLDDDVLVVVTADHGESLGEHDYWFDHGEFVYDTCLRVPLILHGPGVDPIVVPDQVGTIDVAPTILHYFGLPELDAVSGTSFDTALRGSALELRALYAESGEPLFASSNPRFRAYPDLSVSSFDRLRAWCLPDGDKLIVDPLFEGPYAATLFQTRSDPGETVDRAEDPDLAPRLRTAITAMRAIDVNAIERAAASDKVDVRELTPEERAKAKEQLEQAGYVGGSPSGVRRTKTIPREQEPIPGSR